MAQSGASSQPRRRWRRQGPTDGDPEILQRGGKTYFWCGRCRLWNTTHKTIEHVRGGPRPSTQPSSNAVHITQTPQTPSLETTPDSDQPQVFYSSLSVSSFPSDHITPYQQGTSMAFLTRYSQDILQCKRDIDRLKDQLSSSLESKPYQRSE